MTDTATATRAILDPDALLRVPRLGGTALSPDGTQVAFAWSRDGQFQLFVVPVAGGEPRQLTTGTDAVQTPLWTPDGTHILFRRDHDGDENTNLFLIPAEGGTAHPITDSPTSADLSPSFTPDGTAVVFTSNDGDDGGGGVFHVYRVNVDGGRPQQFTAGDDSDLTATLSPDGKHVAFARTVPGQATARTALHLYDLDTGETRTLGVFGTRWTTPHWSVTGATLLFSDDASGFQQVISVDAFSGQVRPVSPPTHDTSDADFSPDGTAMIYLENRDGNIVPVVQDIGSGERRVVTVFPDGVHSDPHLTPDGETLIVTYSGAQHPADIWAVPLNGDAPRQLTRSLTDAIPQDVLVRSDLVRYPSFDGLMIPAWFYRPVGVEKPPVIVLVHGGPTGQSLNGWSAHVQFFVSRGYAVFVPNVRGSTGYGKAYRDANLRDWGGKDLQDLIYGHRWLVAQGEVDPKRIGVTGGSYGGYMTLIAMTKSPEVWAAGVSVVGMSNLRTLYTTTRKGDLLPYLTQQIGTPDDNATLYDERSAINFIEQVRRPLLILQGGRDPRVPLAEAEQMRDRLAAAGKTYDYHVYPDEGHGFRRVENVADSLWRTVAFFDQHMGG